MRETIEVPPAIDIRTGDALEQLRLMPDESVQCVVTSPPYWGLRDYGVDGQIGLEETPEAFVTRLVEVFAEVRRVLRKDGTCWVNIGDSYAGSWGAQGRQGKTGALAGRSVSYARQIVSAEKRLATGSVSRVKVWGLKAKDLVGIPWRVAFALQAEGWWLRSECIWSKANPMPESITDRPSKSHEQVFLLTKRAKYFFDASAVRQPLAEKTFTTFGTKHRAQDNDALGGVKSDNWGRTVRERKPKLDESGEIAGANIRTVWTIASQAFNGAHFATFPEKLAENCILAGCPKGGTVLDPFCGAGTTGLVAIGRGRKFIGIELNPKYVAMARRRIQASVGILAHGFKPPD